MLRPLLLLRFHGYEAADAGEDSDEAAPAFAFPSPLAVSAAGVAQKYQAQQHRLGWQQQL